MAVDLQLSLDAFDRTLPPPCGGRPDRNGFLRLCYRCPFATRDRGSLFCEEFGIPITAWEKYALRGWRVVRDAIMDRDGRYCVICGGSESLHVHHIDLDPTNDVPENLITLCGICHARVHTDLRREGGAARVAKVIAVVRQRGGAARSTPQSR